MFSTILESELHYKSLFSTLETFDDHIKYSDRLLPDMRGHNNILIKAGVHEKHILKLISNALQKRQQEGYDFLKVTLYSEFDLKQLEKLKEVYEPDVSDYLSINTNEWQTFKERKDIIIKECNDYKTMADGSFVDIEANKEAMTEAFAIKRIKRKESVYMDDSNELKLYVAYLDGKPVGNCEVLYNSTMAKIEDFDILESYQRQGIGTHFLRTLLEKINQANINFAYVVTDHDDSAKEMYKKCGFNHEGCITELYYEFGK